MILLWSGFVGFVLLMLALDLGVFHRKAHVVGLRESLLWSGLWTALGLAFAVFVYYAYERHWMGVGSAVDAVDGAVNHGSAAAVKYVTGYVVERSLSIDNVFVIALIFSFFRVPPTYQHRVLFWGILGALVMRGAMIGAGARLIAEFHWVLYLFGGLLILTGLRMLLLKSDHANLDRNPAVRLARRLFPVTDRYHEGRFFVRTAPEGSRASGGALATGGRLMLTPLALALVMVEVSDLVFAVDSIPAIFAITADPFLVFTSNIFAILGLRSLYFALAGVIDRFRYLKTSLAIVLVLVGLKMLFAAPVKKALGSGFNLYLLGAVLFILAAGVAASWIADRRDRAAGPAGDEGGRVA